MSSLCTGATLLLELPPRDHGVRFVMAKRCIVTGLYRQVLSCIEDRQHARQVPFIVLALQDCISFGQGTDDGELIDKGTFTSSPYSLDHWQIHLGTCRR